MDYEYMQHNRQGNIVPTQGDSHVRTGIRLGVGDDWHLRLGHSSKISKKKP